MIESENTSTPPATPVKRGYWAGVKDIGQFGRMFWVFFIFLNIWGMLQHIFSIDIQYQILAELGNNDKSYWKTFIQIVGLSGLIVLGSVADWLGIRRSLVWILTIGSILTCTILIVGLGLGIELNPYIWIVFFCMFAILGSMVVIVRYQALRRYTHQGVRIQAIIISQFIVLPIGPIFFESMSIPVYYKVAFMIVVFILCIIYVLKWLKNENQIVEKNKPAIIITRPKCPFSGIFDVFKSSRIKHVLLFSIIIMLFGFTYTGVMSLIPTCWLSSIDDSVLDSIYRQFALFISVSGLVGFILLIVSIPVIRHFKVGLMIKISILLIFLAVILLSIPVNGIFLIINSSVALLMLEIGFAFLGVSYFEYVLNASPYGREGSMAAILGIVWLLNEPFKKMMTWLIESQKNADWTYTFTQAINTDASNAHALWLIILVPVALGTILLFCFQALSF